MQVEALNLCHFRNLSSVQLLPGPEVNLILGENGQGKTNLLEAIWLCTGGKSFRHAKQEEYPEFSSDFCTIDMALATAQRKKTLHLSFGKKRSVRANGVELTKKADFAGHFICVAFSPNHLELVSGAPEKRRAYINSALCQSNRLYLDQLTRYHAYLKQKNAILKQEMRPSDKEFLLDSYDGELAKTGAFLFAARAAYLDEIETRAVPFYDELSGGREKLDLFYRPGAKEVTEAAFLQELHESRAADLKFCSSEKGPHKDDVYLTLSQKSARAFGSQGQKRSVVLALKLAEAALLEETTGESPVILLDDVLSELDVKRQDYLLNHIQNRQIFVTACEAQKSGVLTGGKTFFVSEGRITG